MLRLKNLKTHLVGALLLAPGLAHAHPGHGGHPEGWSHLVDGGATLFLVAGVGALLYVTHVVRRNQGQ